MLALSILSKLAVLAAAAANVIANPTAKLPVPSGFVTTKGTQFELDGKPFVCPLLSAVYCDDLLSATSPGLRGSELLRKCCCAT